jgi:hypothetical protein
MSDPVIPTPVTPATPPTSSIDKIKAALNTIWATLNADIKSLWNNNKIFVIAFGVLIVLAKGTSWLINFYVNLSKAEVDNATKQDAALKSQEDAANSQANALVNQANNLPSQNKPVDANWDKK